MSDKAVVLLAPPTSVTTAWYTYVCILLNFSWSVKKQLQFAWGTVRGLGKQGKFPTPPISYTRCLAVFFLLLQMKPRRTPTAIAITRRDSVRYPILWIREMKTRAIIRYHSEQPRRTENTVASFVRPQFLPHWRLFTANGRVRWESFTPGRFSCQPQRLLSPFISADGRRWRTVRAR